MEKNLSYKISVDVQDAKKNLAELTQNIQALRKDFANGVKVEIDFGRAYQDLNIINSRLKEIGQNVSVLKANRDQLTFSGVQSRLTNMNERIKTFNKQLEEARVKSDAIGNTSKAEQKFLNVDSQMDKISSKAGAFLEKLNAISKAYSDIIDKAKELGGISFPRVPYLKQNTPADNGNGTSTAPSTPSYNSGASGAKYWELRNAQTDLLKQASDNYAKNFKNNKEAYSQEALRIHNEYRGISKELEEINKVTKSALTTTEMWADHVDKLKTRFNWIATRSIAQWGLDRISESFGLFEQIQTDMAGMAQVMEHTGKGAENISNILNNIPFDKFDSELIKNQENVNSFGKSLMDINTKDLAESLNKTHEPNQAFAKDIEVMQKKLLDIGTQYGATSHDVVESAKLWGRAYKDNLTVLKLTEAATKLAVADNFDIVTANKALEASIMQWGFSIKNATDAQTVSNRIIDSWTALSHNYNVSAQTMVEANRRMAQSATEVGVSFDTAQALIAVMARKTQVDGGEIGNALKSIFGSIHSDKAIKALQDFGIQVYQVGENGQKQFRKVDDVLIDLMIHAEGSTKNMEELLKAISGGKWQWNKASAMLDYGEFIQALRISHNSYGFTDEQVGMQMDTIEKKMQQIKTAWQELLTSQIGGGKVIKDFLGLVVSALEKINSMSSGTIKMFLAIGVSFLAWKQFGVTIGTISARIAWMGEKGVLGVQRIVGAKKEQLALEEALVQKTKEQATAEAALSTQAQKTALAKKEQAATGGGTTVVAGGVAKKASPTSAAGASEVLGLGEGATRVATGLSTALGAVAGAAIAATVAFQGYQMWLRKDQEAMTERMNAHIKLANIYDEQAKRLQDAPPLIETLVNAYDSLKQRHEDLNNTLAEGEEKQKTMSQLDEDMAQTKQALIDIIGEEAADEIMASNDKVSAIKKEQSAVEEKAKEYIENARNERAMAREASNELRRDAEKDIQAINNKSTSYIHLMEIMVKYLDLWDLVRATWNELSLAAGKLIYKMDINLAAKYREWGFDGQADAKLYEADQIAKSNKEDEQALNTIKSNAILAAHNIINSAKSMDGTNSNPPKYTNSDIGDNTPSSGGGGSSSKSSSPKTGNEAVAADNSTNARIVANILLSKGWSREEVSGMIGNLMRESGGDTEDLNTRAVNGSHRGIAQWDSSRWKNLESFAAARGLDVYDIRTQALFIDYERKQGNESVHNADIYSTARLSNNSVEGYAHALNTYYERSGEDSYGREYNARQFDMAFFDGHGYVGGQGHQETPDEKLEKELQEISAQTNKALSLAIDAVNTPYTNTLKEIERQEKLTGKSTETLTQKYDALAKKYEGLQAVSVKFKDGIDEMTKSMKDADKTEMENITGVSLEDFINKDSVSQETIINKLTDDGNKLLKIRLKAINDVTKAQEKYLESLKDVKLELRLSAKERDEFKMSEAEKQTKYKIDKFNTENENVPMNDVDKQKQLQPLLDEQKEEALIRYSYALENKDLYAPEKIQELELSWIKASKAASKYADTLNNNVRQQTHDLVHSILFDGKRLKDIWKDLWKQLAEEALKRLFQIQNGSQSVLGNLISIFTGKQKQSGLMGAILGVAGAYSSGNSNILMPMGYTPNFGIDTVTFGNTLGSVVSTVSSAAVTASGLNSFGYTPDFSKWLPMHATGGIFDKEHIASISEGNKEEVIIPMEGDKNNSLKLLSYAAAKLGSSPSGVTANISQSTITGSKQISNQSTQTLAYMSKMNEMNQTMLNILGNMANAQNNGGEAYLAQPVILKQTMTDSEFVRQFSRLQRLGKLRGNN